MVAIQKKKKSTVLDCDTKWSAWPINQVFESEPSNQPTDRMQIITHNKTPTLLCPFWKQDESENHTGHLLTAQWHGSKTTERASKYS